MSKYISQYSDASTLIGSDQFLLQRGTLYYKTTFAQLVTDLDIANLWSTNGNALGSTGLFGSSTNQIIDCISNNVSVFSFDQNGIIVKDEKPIEFTDSGSNTVSISAPTTITSSYDLKLPIAQGGSDTYLKNDGSGNLSWSAVTGGGGLKSGTATASTTDVYTTTITGVTSYTTNDAYVIKFNTVNSNGATLNINSLGAIQLVKNNDVILTGGDIRIGQEFIVIYDGTNFQMIGVAPNQMFAYVTNADSVTINKGQPVYAFGASGDRMSVKLADNTSEATSSRTVGLVFSSSIAPGDRGFVLTQGVLSNVNTAAYSPGDVLYVGNTPGSLTNVLPYAPNHYTRIGIVERANAGNGLIYVLVFNGFQLDELSDVDITSTLPVNKDVLTYITGTNNLWKPRSISTILGYTPANAAETPKVVIKNSTDASTSSLTYVILYSGLITANTFTTGDLIRIEATFRKTGTVNNYVLRLNVNTSNSLTGATQIATRAPASNIAYSKIRRLATIKSATNTEIYPATTSQNVDFTETSTTAASALNIDWTVNQYIIVSALVTNATDSAIFSSIIVEKI